MAKKRVRVDASTRRVKGKTVRVDAHWREVDEAIQGTPAVGKGPTRSVAPKRKTAQKRQGSKFDRAEFDRKLAETDAKFGVKLDGAPNAHKPVDPQQKTRSQLGVNQARKTRRKLRNIRGVTVDERYLDPKTRVNVREIARHGGNSFSTTAKLIRTLEERGERDKAHGVQRAVTNLAKGRSVPPTKEEVIRVSEDFLDKAARDTLNQLQKRVRKAKNETRQMGRQAKRAAGTAKKLTPEQKAARQARRRARRAAARKDK